MKISIVTINRNNAAGLRRSLMSIASQSVLRDSRHSVRHIVVDGMSDDGSLDAVADLTASLGSVVISLEPRGVYHAINAGLDLASGDIVGLLHAGDELASDSVLADIAGRFETDPQLGYTYGDVTVGRRYYSGAGFDRKSVLTGFAPPHPSLYIRTCVQKQVGPYDESLRVAADFDLFVRLLLADGIKGAYHPGKTVVMEPGGMSQSLGNRLWHNNSERLRSLRLHGLPASRWRLSKHYLTVLKGFLCSSTKS